MLTARRRARELADSLGFDTTDQVRIATAISELGRVIGAAGATARVDFDVDQREQPALRHHRASRPGADAADSPATA